MKALFISHKPPYPIIDGGCHAMDRMLRDFIYCFPNAKIEYGMETDNEQTYQFERLGYFKKDSKLEHKDKSVYIRVVSLRDSWAKALKK